MFGTRRGGIERNFAEAFGFVRQVADLAEAEGHHPDISFGWGYVTVSLQTKKIMGLHEKFIMAAKLDHISTRPAAYEARAGTSASVTFALLDVVRFMMRTINSVDRKSDGTVLLLGGPTKEATPAHSGGQKTAKPERTAPPGPPRGTLYQYPNPYDHQLMGAVLGHYLGGSRMTGRGSRPTPATIWSRQYRHASHGATLRP